MADVDVRVELNMAKFNKVVFKDPMLGAIVSQKTNEIASRANSLSSGFRTEKWHDHKTGEVKGETPAEYVGDTNLGSYTYRGIIHPANYSAMKDNHLHNTLLKAKG